MKLLLLLPICLFASHLKTLHSSLDPSSVSKQLAFYQLYPDSPEGKKALKRAWHLLGNSAPQTFNIPKLDLEPLIALVNREPLSKPNLSLEALELIEHIASHLGNRSLPGHSAWSIDDLNELTDETIDLARALLLYEFDDPIKIRQYEATLDLMALQIGARLSLNATDEDKVYAINDFIFHEMRYRFPPHSQWTEDVDLYTFLPAVMDSRKGVCLGVSILYLSLAQRLNLSLEIVTPPGHIYVRYRKNDSEVINIETTARGIHVPCETYLSIHTKSLHTRKLKEVVGLAFVNQAATCWQKKDYPLAVSLYERAQPFLPDDPLVKMLLGYNYLFTNQIAKGTQLLKEIQNITFEGSITKETLPDDYLRSRVDIEGIKTVFQHVDEKRSSIEEKQAKLQKALKRYPKFRDGWFHLAVTHFQLNQHSDALKALEKLHSLDPTQPTVEYYLSQLKLMRLKPIDAWKHFDQATALLNEAEHNPPCMQQLKKALTQTYPRSTKDIQSK